jgi:nicotinate-nucleotide--dimethylbenzimidazole phosphoribosyltransferase
MQAAVLRQARLTKPAGALGALESVAISLAGHQGRECPRIDKPCIVVFASDHGVAAQGVSAYPQSVTAQMVLNFMAGGAAINVLAGMHGAHLTVVDMGVRDFSLPAIAHSAGPDFVSACCSPHGTADFSQGPAMSPAQLENAMQAGRNAVLAAQQRGCDLFIAGEMGIGNTTSAAALACAILRRPAVELVGLGTGISSATHHHKCRVVEQALSLHADHIGPGDAFETLRRLGGFEIAAITGAALTCAQVGLTFLVDGFIVSAAVMMASRIRPESRHWMLFAHQSAEAGHNAVLSELDAKPLMQLNMRLGEGSGAATAIPLLQTACQLHAGMATFDSARVSNRAEGV